MRTFAQEPKAGEQAVSARSTASGRAHVGRNHDALCAGNHDFSRIPIWSRDAPASYTAEEAEPHDQPGPVSESLDAGAPLTSMDAGGPSDAGVPLPGGVPAPPASPPPPPCTITTRTLVAAPGGTTDARQRVGVNEQVEMTASASAVWAASSGTFRPAAGRTMVWTAPGAGGTASITATPATGAPCSASMTVVPPSSRALTKNGDRAYTAGLAGSGFTASVVIMPTQVSFTRTELREETVSAVATGYYDTALSWNGLVHPTTPWLSPDAANSGLVDTIGTGPPGAPGPFSPGTFLWAIPQSFRAAGSSGSGTVYSTANHSQIMSGATGAETTSKEGASRARTP